MPRLHILVLSCRYFKRKLPERNKSAVVRFLFSGLLFGIFCLVTMMLIHLTSLKYVNEKFSSDMFKVRQELLNIKLKVPESMKALSNNKSQPLYTIKTLDNDLNEEELDKYHTCVNTGPREREQNGSLFWSVDHMRTTHHTYLKENDSVIMEVGGNIGVDASDYIRLYNPKYLIILEPVAELADKLTNMFQNNPRVVVMNLGIGTKTENIKVTIAGVDGDATSKFMLGGGTTPISIMNTTEFLLDIGVGFVEIDLLTLNCEGCEYEALEALLSSCLVKHFRNIQFATHSTLNGLSSPIERYCRIQQLLSRTHRPTYQYTFIWESWRRKDIA